MLPGPWADQFLRARAVHGTTKSLRLVKGSHIVVPRLFDHPYAYIFQNPDKRIIFAIPYEDDFTLIGTTDVEHSGGIDEVHISAEEISYLCQQASRYFKKPVRESDVVWSYSGVRPLIDDESGNAAAVTRDYRLELHRDGPPLLTVWGGKITTYRKLAEEAADAVSGALGRKTEAWQRAAHFSRAATLHHILVYYADPTLISPALLRYWHNASPGCLHAWCGALRGLMAPAQ